MKTTLILFISLLFFSSRVIASEAGLGIALSDDDTTIYAPLQIGETIKLTPFANYYSLKRDGGFYNKYSREIFVIGAGIFKLFPMQYNTHFYSGLRLGYTEDSRIQERPIINGTYSLEEKKRGYIFSPTLGFEYHINKPISISAEIDWTFKNLKGKTSDSQFESTDDARNKSNYTETRVIFTYYFE